MIAKPFEPTDEQRRVIEQAGSTFIAACPGAGKTRVTVERARKRLGGGPTGHGMVFPSFTIAAVSELEDRLRRERLVETPAFPHFIGTFDAFLWQFLIAPFGVDGCAAKPRLIPDKDDRTIQPFERVEIGPERNLFRRMGERPVAKRHPVSATPGLSFEAQIATEHEGLDADAVPADILTGCVSRSYQVLQRFMKRVRHPDIASSPARCRRAKALAPRRSFLIRSPGFRGVSPGGAHSADYPHCRELTLNVVATSSSVADELDDTMSTRQTSSKLVDCCRIVLDRADVSNLTRSFSVRHCDRNCLLMHRDQRRHKPFA
ncbi:hypothetical protein CV770_33620 [Bradyrhizobium sp. AC87j1]|uniref:UvrD-helicase domain-containing protein n=1 Tax=Bradyrhizobium sp. AC87j1 TaxID=2055894 RepID=UPI000CEC5A66|nr:UvrD-helicase domain-containing protein [Bradyrhizobium sp. AC87j1]PPQ15047.1 hypothetical protein CV770_33620 [Bradyrhizobium sp. AC87j1]